MKHKIIKQLDERGIKTNFFIKKHNLSTAGFYGTVSGQRKDRKTIKALKKEGLFVFLVDVYINDVETKYPNFSFNYKDKQDFLENNIVPSLEHITDEQEYDAGYETVVANSMLDLMDSFVEVGDNVGFIHKSGYMGKNAVIKTGKVIEKKVFDEMEIYEIEYISDKGRKCKVTRDSREIINIYDLLKQ